MRAARRMGIAALTAAGLVAGLVGAAPARAATGQIFYETFASGNADIWVMNADGTGQTNITNTPAAQEYDPELSPDGSRVAFISNRDDGQNVDGNFEIFVMNPDGTNVVQITNTDSTAPGAFVQSYDPTWSPDGAKLAFNGYREWSSSEIFVINADGSGSETKLTNPGDFASKWEPDWSPDGTKILFTWGFDEFSQNLHVINPDGSGETNLSAGMDPEYQTAERNGAWSPDGNRIAFRWDKDCCGIYPNVNAEIYVMEYPSLVTTRVTEHDAVDEDPAWSPDGTQITFTSLRNGTYDLFLVDAPPVAAPAGAGVMRTAAAPSTTASSTGAPAPVTPLNTAAGDQQDPFWAAGGTTPPPATHTLTVTKSGPGRVSSSPAGIACGTDCTESYSAGTQVTLTAKPNTGYSFTGWAGACTGTATTCTVTMDAARSATATFGTTPPPGGTHTLTVTKSGPGRVTSSPAGIACGTDCTESYSAGTQVTLTAKPNTGYSFTGWSGDCSGTSLTCTVTMDAARSVTATFGSAPPPGGTHTLTVTKAGTGRGQVSSSPAGIACGTDCTESYSAGTQVTLTARAASGYTFGGWSGACTGTSATCTVTMDAAKTVTATFN